MVAQIARQRPAVLRGDSSRHVERIANKWMSRGSEVYAYLMRPAGCDADLKQGTVSTPFKNLDMAVSRLPDRGCGVNRLENRVRNRADGSVDVELIGGRAPGG